MWRYYLNGEIYVIYLLILLTNCVFIDYLLDDLQSSVARSKSKDMQYLSPSNTTTVVRERSISPGGGVSTSEHFSYIHHISHDKYAVHRKTARSTKLLDTSIRLRRVARFLSLTFNRKSTHWTLYCWT